MNLTSAKWFQNRGRYHLLLLFTNHGKRPCEDVGDLIKILSAKATLQQLYDDKLLTV